MNNTEPCGIICVDKPQDFTSFDIVALARKAIGTRRIGHGGTLDPMAVGVLPLFIGRAAKTVDLLPDSRKQYKAGFRLGAESDTEDVWGNVIETSSAAVSLDRLEKVSAMFIGEIDQTPPMYSAVKIQGRRLYDIARSGQVVERPSRRVTVSDIKILDYDEDTRRGELLIDCSKGTYIRTLIADIGKTLGTGGIMTSLVRTRSAGFLLSDCITLDELKALSSDEIKSRLIPTELSFSGCREEKLDDMQARLFINGTIPAALAARLGENELVRIKDRDERFLGLVRTDEKRAAGTVYLEVTASAKG